MNPDTTPTPQQRATEYNEPFDLPLRYDPESDWGWIRDANEHTACLARKSLDNREADEYRRIREDPMKKRAERIVACVNACAGMPDPAAEIKALSDLTKHQSAQIVALSEALKELKDSVTTHRDCSDTDREASRNRKRVSWALNQAGNALSTPPPPVVPLVDVRLLVEALRDCYDATEWPADGTSKQEQALATFTAKHPLP